MKSKILFIICAVICATSIITAQANQPPIPNNYNKYLFRIKGYSDSGAVAYYTGRVDTIAFTYVGTDHHVSTYLPWAGCSFSTIKIAFTDTANVGIIVKRRTKADVNATASDWTTILTDSLKNRAAHADSLVKEFSLKDTDSDLFDGLDQEFMIILTHAAWTVNDTQGTARRRVYFISKD